MANELNIPSEETLIRIAEATENLSPDSKIGNLQDLITDTKTNTVGAINEVKQQSNDIADLIDGRIIEEVGSNEKGYYTRFEDGLQVSVAYATLDTSSTSLQTVSLPVFFASNTRKSITISNGAVSSITARNARASIVGAQMDDTTVGSCQVYCDGSGSVKEYEVSILAIGRWKR